MRLFLSVRCLLGLVLIGIMLLLAQSEALSQNKLPPRPPIFLNNNASLYTFPNPNVGKPSQLAFAFVAVAHEDCRLFNNGAKLMPKHRLIAAECMAGTNNGQPPGPLPPGQCQVGWCWDPSRFGVPVLQINCPRLPGTVTTAVCIDIRTTPPVAGGTVNGMNFGRIGMPGPMPYPYPYAGGGNYGSYNPNSSSSGAGSESSLTTQSRGYRGFSLPNEEHMIEFITSVGTDPLTRFGSGFGITYNCCPNRSESEKDKAAENDSE